MTATVGPPFHLLGTAEPGPDQLTWMMIIIDAVRESVAHWLILIFPRAPSN
jgi:hypothetical protein